MKVTLAEKQQLSQQKAKISFRTIIHQEKNTQPQGYKNTQLEV